MGQVVSFMPWPSWVQIFSAPCSQALLICVLPSVEVWDPVKHFVTSCLLWWDVVSPLSNPDAGGSPLVGCLQLLIYSQLPSISGGYLLHPQPNDAPCPGDRDPHNMGKLYCSVMCVAHHEKCLPDILCLHYFSVLVLCKVANSSPYVRFDVFMASLCGVMTQKMTWMFTSCTYHCNK
jgi:hypothetical protein